jgi:DNA-binding NarL/FixJ family response regulator
VDKAQPSIDLRERGNQERNGLVVGSVFPAGAWAHAAAVLGVSAKDIEVLERILRGESEKEVAAQIGASRRAVHARLERLYRRLDVHSRTELIVAVVAALGRASG